MYKRLMALMLSMLFLLSTPAYAAESRINKPTLTLEFTGNVATCTAGFEDDGTISATMQL